MTRTRATTRGGPALDCSGYRRRIRLLCASLPAAAVNRNERLASEARLAGDELPAPLRRLLDAFRSSGNRHGYLRLTGFVPAPPACASACLALIGGRLGDLAGYEQERAGALFHDIRPVRREEREQAAGSSTVELELHTERCFHPFLPSHVLLACIRADPARQARTSVASVRRILPLLAARVLPDLRRAEFRTGIDYSFAVPEARRPDGPVMSVLYGNRDDPFLRYDLDLMAGLTSRARVALAAVRQAALRACRFIPLAPGDLLVIDNRRAVHGRTGFVARYDGSDRWLKRAYVVGDLSAAAADCRPGERIIRTRF